MNEDAAKMRNLRDKQVSLKGRLELPKLDVASSTLVRRSFRQPLAADADGCFRLLVLIDCSS